MNGQPRYGIYFAPERASAFWQFSSAWLGWDAETGEERTRPSLLAGAAADWDAAKLEKLIKVPKSYGFHGTLKPPFRLADGQSIELLSKRAEVFARSQKAFICANVGVAAIGQFIAFRLKTDPTAMQALAQETVEVFDPFRAPPPLEETAKRRAAGLTDRQEVMLQKWGYPYVFDEFRFHMTLTGSIDDASKQDRLASSLSEMASAAGASGAMRVSGIALYEQLTPETPFRLIRRLPFCGG